MDFIAIDVETANASMASICQIGIARYADGQMVEEWSSLINPEEYFDPVNVDIHGIDEAAVEGSPGFPDVVDVLHRLMDNTICVCHTHFDRVSIGQVLAKYELAGIDAIWLDSAKVARRTWEDCAWRGYGLADVCRIISYEFKHHDALEDAKAAAQVLLAAIDVAGLDVEAWLKRVRQPINPTKSSKASGNRARRGSRGRVAR